MICAIFEMKGVSRVRFNTKLSFTSKRTKLRSEIIENKWIYLKGLGRLHALKARFMITKRVLIHECFSKRCKLRFNFWWFRSVLMKLWTFNHCENWIACSPHKTCKNISRRKTRKSRKWCQNIKNWKASLRPSKTFRTSLITGEASAPENTTRKENQESKAFY